MYIPIGQHDEGTLIYRCCRGTNALEGFHRQIRDLLQRHVASPRLASSILQHYVYRWNMKMGTQSRGIRNLPECYRQDLVEDLHELTIGWWPPSMYSDRKRTRLNSSH